MDVEGILSIIITVLPGFGTIPGWLNMGRVYQVRKNLLNSWTVAVAAPMPGVRMNGVDYVVFTVGGYRRVPWKYKWIRLGFGIHQLLCLAAIVVLALAVILPAYAVKVLVSALSANSSAFKVDSSDASTLIGCAVILGVSMFVVGFLLRSFEPHFLEKHGELDTRGENVEAP